MSINEYNFLLHSYKSMFALLQNNLELAESEHKKAGPFKKQFESDPVKFKGEISLPAALQHQGLHNNTMALIQLEKGAVMKAIQKLSNEDKSKAPHPSCHTAKQTDEASLEGEGSTDSKGFRRCSQMHPLYFFNNLGLVHMRLRKFNLAIFYFSKALRFVDKN